MPAIAAYALPFVRVSVSESVCRAAVVQAWCHSVVGMGGPVYLVVATLWNHTAVVVKVKLPWPHSLYPFQPPVRSEENTVRTT